MLNTPRDWLNYDYHDVGTVTMLILNKNSVYGTWILMLNLVELISNVTKKVCFTDLMLLVIDIGSKVNDIPFPQKSLHKGKIKVVGNSLNIQK